MSRPCVRLKTSGCGAAWLARLLGVQEVPGSNPGRPTNPFRELRRSVNLKLALCDVVCDVTAYWTVSEASSSAHFGCEIRPPESLSRASLFAAIRTWL